MVKFYRVLSIFAFIAVWSGQPFVYLTSQASIVSQNNPQPEWRDGSGRWRQTFNNNEPPQSRDGGSRGAALCFLTPLDEATGINVFNDRPRFIWRGEFARIELYASNQDQPIWSQDLAQTDEWVQYDGEALKPGQTYDLMMFATVADAFPFPTKQIQFTVIDGEKRQQVSQGLDELNLELQQNGASEEDIAFFRFEYLVENQFWSDALIEAFSVENPSSELQGFLQEMIPEHFCN